MSRLDEIRSQLKANRHPLSLADQDVVRFEVKPGSSRIRCISLVTRKDGLLIGGRAPGSAHNRPIFFAETVREGEVLATTRLRSEELFIFIVGTDGTLGLHAGAEIYWEPYNKFAVAPFIKKK